MGRVSGRKISINFIHSNGIYMCYCSHKRFCVVNSKKGLQYQSGGTRCWDVVDRCCFMALFTGSSNALLFGYMLQHWLAFMDFATGTTRSLNSVLLYTSVCSFSCATATLPYHLLFQILKFEWPRNWPTFISDIVGASKTNESLCQNNMIILKLLR